MWVRGLVVMVGLAWGFAPATSAEERVSARARRAAEWRRRRALFFFLLSSLTHHMLSNS